MSEEDLQEYNILGWQKKLNDDNKFKWKKTEVMMTKEQLINTIWTNPSFQMHLGEMKIEVLF